MNTINVSFEIISNECSLFQITNKIGVTPSVSSVDKGTMTNKNKIADKTVWKIVSENEEYKTIADHLKNIFTFDFVEKLSKPESLPKDSKFYLNIGVFYTEFYTSYSLIIPGEYIKLFKQYDFDIGISFYPCSE